MKQTITLIAVGSVLLAARGQGTFVYDQQSSTEAHFGEGGRYIEQSQPFGQSFTPSLSAVGFVRLFLNNGLGGDTSQATVYLNLRSGSINGAILGQSAPVTIPGGSLFVGTVDFVFTNTISVSPGLTYLFQPVVQDNNNIQANVSQYGYAGGAAIITGASDNSLDFWFREGLYIVPEPSTAGLLLLGSIVVFQTVRKRSIMDD